MRWFTGIIIFTVSIFVSPWVILPLAVLHALSWFALELVVFGVLIDVYFGVGISIPYYTLSALLIVFIAEYVKPYLTFYSE